MANPTGASKPGGVTLGLFFMAVVVGGANFIGVRFSNRELDPFWGAALRFTIAASLFLIIAAALRLPWPRKQHLWLNVLYGLLSFSVSYALMYWALVQVSAGVATVVLAIVPLVTLLLAAAQGMERLGIRSVIGSLLAILGIVWMSLGPQDVVLPFTALLAMLLAAMSMGESVIVGKKLSGYHPAITNAVGMTTGAIMLLVLSAAVGDQWVLPSEPEVIWSVIYLVTIGSVGLFVLVILVVRQWTASATSYVFVLFPIVTMVLGALIADEPITGQGVTGALLVISGVWFGALSPNARTASSSSADRPHPARHVI